MPADTPFIFPVSGLNKTASFDALPAGTTNDAINVRPHDPFLGKLRGGRRAGLSRWAPTSVSGGEPISWMSRAAKAAVVSTAQDAYLFANSPDTITVFDSILGQLWTVNFPGGTIRAMTRGLDGYYFVVWAGGQESLYKYSLDGLLLWTTPGFGTESGFFEHDHNLEVDDTIQRGWYVSENFNPNFFSFNLDTGEILFTLNLFGSAGESVWKSPDGNLFVLTPNKGILKLDQEGNQLADFPIFSSGGINKSMDISTDNKIVIVSSEPTANWGGDLGDGTVKDTWVLNLNLDTVFATYRLDPGSLKNLRRVRWVPNLDSFFLIELNRLDRYDSGVLAWDVFNTHFADIEIDFFSQILVTGSVDPENNNYNVWFYDFDGNLISETSVGTTGVRGQSFSKPPTDGALVDDSLVTVSNGTINRILEDKTITIPTNGTNALERDLFAVSGTSLYGFIYFVDGTNFKRLDIKSNTVENVVATAGVAPSKTRLAARFRGRLVLSGTEDDPHNYFMSRQGDPLDWDIAPATPDARTAVAGNLSEAGLIGDVITAIMPVSDDIMLFGCDSSIWAMTGDPAAGGAVDLVSDKLGVAWGQDVWTLDTSNNLYFMGLDGVYRFRTGAGVENLTLGRMDTVFKDVDFATTRIQLAWDVIRKQLWVLVRYFNEKETEVFIWDQRTNSWWEDQYALTIRPTFMLSYDANKIDDLAFLYGSRDGVIRRIDDMADDDDGIGISSHIRFAPVVSRDPGQQQKIVEAAAIIGENSGDIDLNVYAGQTTEQLALSTVPKYRKKLRAGRNGTISPRIEAPAIAVELNQSDSHKRWALERLGVRIKQAGRARRRRR